MTTMPTADRPLTWDDVRDVPFADLAVGDRYIIPPLGTACSVSPDGRVRGWMWTPLDGSVWTVVRRASATEFIVRGVDGSESPVRLRYSDSTALCILPRPTA